MAYGNATKASAAFDRFVTVDVNRERFESLWARPERCADSLETSKLKIWQKLVICGTLAAISWVPFFLIYQALN